MYLEGTVCTKDTEETIIKSFNHTISAPSNGDNSQETNELIKKSKVIPCILPKGFSSKNNAKTKATDAVK